VTPRRGWGRASPDAGEQFLLVPPDGVDLVVEGRARGGRSGIGM
jgi:hypothetical protein